MSVAPWLCSPPGPASQPRPGGFGSSVRADDHAPQRSPITAGTPVARGNGSGCYDEVVLNRGDSGGRPREALNAAALRRRPDGSAQRKRVLVNANDDGPGVHGHVATDGRVHRVLRDGDR